MADLDEDTFYTFTWKIENFSFLFPGEIDAELSSPSFKIRTTKPAEFQIYLTSGDWSAKDIRLRTLRCPPDLVLFKRSELSLLRNDGEVIESCCQQAYLRDSQFYLYPKPALFSNHKVLEVFLPQDTLIIRWKVYAIGSGECFFRTVFYDKYFRWSISEFSKHQTFTKIVQVASLYVTVDLSKLEHNIIIAKFIPLNTGKDRLHFGNCAIIAVGKEKGYYSVYRYGKVNVLCYKIIPPRIPYVRYEDNILIDQHWEAPVVLNEGVCSLIENDTLTLQWEFTIGIAEVWNVNSNALEPQVSPITLRSDLLRLYEDRKFCDVTLKTGTTSFPVHKTVLCARSPVFCAMFEGDTEESRTGFVHIPDIEPDTLERMLLFLYKDTLGEVPWEMLTGLFYAADKYHIQTLKDRCASSMIENLSLSNVCDVLVLADIHQDEGLMQAVKDLVLYHESVISSEQWKELEKENPQLVDKFLREINLK